MIHKKIRQLRIEKKFTQQDMAEALHISQNAYCLIEKGATRLIDYERIILIAEKLQVNPIELDLFNAAGFLQNCNDKHELSVSFQNELKAKNVQIEQLLKQNKQLISRLLKQGKNVRGGVI